MNTIAMMKQNGAAMVSDQQAVGEVALAMLSTLRGGFPLKRTRIMLANGKDDQICTENDVILVAALSIVLSSDYTNDALLFASLSTSLKRRALSIDLDEVVDIRRWFTDTGVIARQSSQVEYVVDGKLKIGKAWAINPELRAEVKEHRAELEAKAIKPMPTDKATVTQMRREKTLDTFAKGQAASVDAAMAKIEAVALMIDPSAEGLLTQMAMALITSDEVRATAAQAAKMLEFIGSVFHLPAKCDWRGRVYYTTVLSPQGNKQLRNLYRFADGEAIHWMDATCSGIQHMAALMKDANTARVVNLTGSERSDLYQEIADSNDLSRDEAKKLVMPYAYGASTQSLSGAVGLSEDDLKPIIYKMNSEYPCVSSFQRWVNLGATKHFAHKAELIEWTVDGFTSVMDYHEVQSIHAGSWSVSQRVGSDIPKMIRALAPNIIHSYDAALLRRVVNEASFEVVVIHDCFGVREKDLAALNQLVVKCMRELHSDNPLEVLAQSLRFGLRPTLGDLDLNDIVNLNMIKAE